MRAKLALSLALALALLPGCASNYGERRTSAQYYPACYKPIEDLRQNEHVVGESTGIGALIGGLSGVGIGLLTTKGDWRGAAMGGALGAVGGTMVGASYGEQQKRKSENIRLNGYLQNIDGDISDLDVVSAAAKISLQCYDQQFAALLAQARAKALTREACAARFAEIQAGREEAISILGAAAQHGTSASDEYALAYNSWDPAEEPGLKRAKQRRAELAASAGRIAALRNEAIDTGAKQSREMNEAMAKLL